MNLFSAFLKLIRWPNLLFIALTQILFYAFIIDPYYPSNNPLTHSILALVCTASVLIAAAGYIINDYFDLNIDQINKPERLIISTFISRRWAIFWHLFFSATGIIISLYISLHSNFIVFIGNTVCVLLLWLYSTTFKKQLLIGNIIISLLTAWVIVVLYLCMSNSFIFYSPGNFKLHKIFRFAILYASFAFVISLVREVVKDIEDISGDAKYGCKTMPIVWGIPVSKVFSAVWLIVLLGALIILQFYVLQIGWWIFSVYSTLLVIIPLFFIIKNLRLAQNINHYTSLSKHIKLVMLTGILSMVIIRFYL